MSARDARHAVCLGEGHGAEVGDLIVNGAVRLRVVQVLDPGGVVVVRRPRWYDGLLTLAYLFAEHYRAAVARRSGGASPGSDRAPLDRPRRP